MAKICSCAIYLGVPTEQPVLSPRQHVYCESRIGHWLKFSNVCCVCKQLTEMEDLVPLKMHLKELHVLLEVHCENGCTNLFNLSELDELHDHERTCQFKLKLQ